MNYNIADRACQLLPIGNKFTAIAAAQAAADTGKQVLFVASSRSGGRRMLAADSRAAWLDRTTEDTRIFVVLRTHDISELRYDDTILDVVADTRTHRDEWFKWMQTYPLMPSFCIAFRKAGELLVDRRLAWVEKEAMQTALEIKATPAEAFDKLDRKMHGIRKEAEESWGGPEFLSGLYQKDFTARTKSVSLNQQAILEGADGLWVEEGRRSRRIQGTEAWAGRELTDEEVLCELKKQSLTMLRVGYDPRWAVEQQRAELHSDTAEDLKEIGVDVYADDRKNLATHLFWLHQLLGPTISEKVIAGASVRVTAVDSMSCEEYARDVFARGGYRVLRILDRSHGSIAKRMKGKGSSTQNVHFVTTLLEHVGYLKRTSVRTTREEGRKRAFIFEPAVNKQNGNASVTDPGSTSSFEEDFSGPEQSIKREYIDCSGPVGETAEPPVGASAPEPTVSSPAPTPVTPQPDMQDCLAKPNGNPKRSVEDLLKARPPSDVTNKGKLMPGFVVDVKALQNQGKPGPVGDGYDATRDVVWAAVLSHTGPNDVLHIPSNAKGMALNDPKGRRGSFWPGTKALLQGVSKVLRPHMRALPGRTILNFDFRACHMVIAAALVAQHSGPCPFVELCRASDPYAAFAARFATTRAEAKVLMLSLLNGMGLPLLCARTGWSKERGAALLASWTAIAAPWVRLTEMLYKTDPVYGSGGARVDTYAGSRGALELQRHERRLQESLYTAVQKAAPELRLLATMYDGALFDVATADPDLIAGYVQLMRDEAVKLAAKVGYPSLPVKAGAGLTWADAEATST